MTGSARPRHSRKEIRDFGDWLTSLGWSFEGTDSKHHSIWSHPRSSQRYKLPETPRHFDVQKARREVLRLIGETPAGKRRGKATVHEARRDFVVESASRAADERDRAEREAAARSRALRRRQAAAAAKAEAEDRERRFYEALMQPGYGGRR